MSEPTPTQLELHEQPPHKHHYGAPDYAPAQDALDAVGIEAVCHMAREGLSLTAIAAECHVGLGSLARWLGDPTRAALAKAARNSTAWHWDGEAERELRAASLADPSIASAAVSRARELASHFRWRAARYNASEYGDKLLHTGGDGIGPVQVRVALDCSRLTADQLETLDTLLSVARGERDNPLGLVIDGELIEPDTSEEG